MTLFYGFGFGLHGRLISTRRRNRRNYSSSLFDPKAQRLQNKGDVAMVQEDGTKLFWKENTELMKLHHHTIDKSKAAHQQKSQMAMRAVHIKVTLGTLSPKKLARHNTINTRGIISRVENSTIVLYRLRNDDNRIKLESMTPADIRWENSLD